MRGRRQSTDAAAAALRTGDQPAVLLLAEVGGGAEPGFETMLFATGEVENDHGVNDAGSCLVPGAGIEPAWLAPRDFKSLVSTSFTIRAGVPIIARDRRGP